MGNSTTAILAYGYNLGSDDAGWEVTEIDDEGELLVDWWADPAVYGEGDDDFILAAMTRLDAEQAAAEFESYGHHENARWILAAKVINVAQSRTQILTPELMTVEPDWDDALTAALRTLGLTPKQEKPAWLLCSSWG